MQSNPKTTWLGIIAGILMTFGSVAQARVNNPAAPPITFGNIAPGVAIAALGALSKDHDNHQ